MLAACFLNSLSLRLGLASRAYIRLMRKFNEGDAASGQGSHLSMTSALIRMLGRALCIYCTGQRLVGALSTTRTLATRSALLL